MGVYFRKESRLPSEYQEVEYIQSSGTQYIDTGFVITPKTKTEADFQYLSKVQGARIDGIGSDNSSTSGATRTRYLGNNAAYFKFGIGNGTNQSGTWDNIVMNSDTDRHIFVAENGRASIYSTSGVLQASVVTQNIISQNCNHSSGLFAKWDWYYSAFNNNSSGRLYGYKMWDNDVMVRDYVPCYRKSDNVIGLYDLVNDQFYTNNGTGTFTKGNDVNTGEISNAYIGNRGLSKIYIGDNLVRPTATTEEYYIDFRNNSLSGIKEDGWIPNNGDSHVVLDSNGYQMSGAHGDGIYKMFDFSNAKKIIFDSIMYRQQGGWIGLDIVRLGDTINMFLAGYYSSSSYVNYSGYGIYISPEGYADTSSAYRGSYPNGDYTIKLEADLESKVVTLTGTPQTITRSITDANVASVRSSGKLYVEPGSPQYVRRLSITIYNN